MEELKRADSSGSGVILAVIDQMATTSQAIYLDDEGNWSGRFDYFPYDIENDLDSILLLLLVFKILWPKLLKTLTRMT